MGSSRARKLTRGHRESLWRLSLSAWRLTSSRRCSLGGLNSTANHEELYTLVDPLLRSAAIIWRSWRSFSRSVADLDPHRSASVWEPGSGSSAYKSKDGDRGGSQFEAMEAHPGAIEAHPGAVEAYKWAEKSHSGVLEDLSASSCSFSHHFDGVADPHQSLKSDPNPQPHQNEKSDPHHCPRDIEADSSVEEVRLGGLDAHRGGLEAHFR